MSPLLIVQNSTPDQFILGPLISEGVRDVVKDVNDPHPLPEVLGKTTDYGKTRIIVEKFIYIKDRENISYPAPDDIYKRSDSLFGVVNIDKWRSYINAYKDTFYDYDIENLWSSWEFGIRISYVMPELEKEFDLKERQDNKAFKVYFNDKSSPAGLIPLVTVKKKIENQQISTDIIDQFDESCLVYDLAIDPKYQILFQEAVDIETLISLLTIYSMNNYELFLGEGERDMSDLNKWQRDPKYFNNTKEALIEILKDFK